MFIFSIPIAVFWSGPFHRVNSYIFLTFVLVFLTETRKFFSIGKILGFFFLPPWLVGWSAIIRTNRLQDRNGAQKPGAIHGRRVDGVDPGG